MGQCLKKWCQDNSLLEIPASAKPPKPFPHCALGDFLGSASNNCPKLPHTKQVVTDTFFDPKNLWVYVIFPKLAKRICSLRTNHPCALCNNYDHYFHHCLHIEDFRDTLHVLLEIEVARTSSTPRLLMEPSLTLTLDPEVSQPPIMIPPPNVEITDNTTLILYLSTFM